MPGRWKERMIALGLDPDRDGTGKPVRIQTRSIEEYKRWLRVPSRRDSVASDLTPAAVAALDDAQLREAVRLHVTNERTIDDPAVIQAVEERAGGFELSVQAQQDLPLDGTQYVIDSTAKLATFGQVTLTNGGSILISIDTTFECDTLEKIQTTSASTVTNAYDVYCYGIKGADGTGGSTPQPNPPEQAEDGKDARCDDIGGTIEDKATDGTNGADGLDGTTARSNGANAFDAGTKTFIINESLTGTLSFLLQGGAGGIGGNGGNGQDGQKGGDGGDGKQCWGITAHGAHGGRGGDGGNGGSGLSGGNGGGGGRLNIDVPANSKVSAVAAESAGGDAGAGGEGGHGGQGGRGGAKGGGDGEPGKNGLPGNPGAFAGQSGARGTIAIYWDGVLVEQY